MYRMIIKKCYEGKGKKKTKSCMITRIQGRSQYEANRGTCLSHLRFDAGSVLFKRSHP